MEGENKKYDYSKLLGDKRKENFLVPKDTKYFTKEFEEIGIKDKLPKYSLVKLTVDTLTTREIETFKEIVMKDVVMDGGCVFDIYFDGQSTLLLHNKVEKEEK